MGNFFFFQGLSGTLNQMLQERNAGRQMSAISTWDFAVGSRGVKKCNQRRLIFYFGLKFPEVVIISVIFIIIILSQKKTLKIAAVHLLHRPWGLHRPSCFCPGFPCSQCCWWRHWWWSRPPSTRWCPEQAGDAAHCWRKEAERPPRPQLPEVQEVRRD